ncbi:MAG: hypothetical protein JWR40_4579 [Massilia sp.]|jgi:uncharacterized protein (DUF697 family)|nr:hypothetical protein [Massilia sp.]MDB5948231.1 hypothetical protein [Massilia sp.]
MTETLTTDWTLIPGSNDEIAKVRERCRRLVRRRATMAAGFSAVPLPGLDMVSDMSLFVRLVDEVNAAFGLTPQQVERLQPKYRLMAYEAAVGMGGMLVGRLVTRELLMTLFKKMGVKIATKTAAKLVPIAGSVVSAAIGFAMFRQLGYQHVEACVKVADKLRTAHPA